MEMLAYEEAVSLLERALDLAGTTPATDSSRCELLLALGDARAATGDRAAAREALAAAAEDSRLQGRFDLLARAALGLAPGDGFEVALFDSQQVGLLDEALAGLEPASSEHAALRAWCQARLSVALALTGQDERRVALSDAAVTSARQADDPAALAHALAARCDSHAGPADVEMRLSDSSEIVALSRTGFPRGGGLRSGLWSELLGRRLRLVALLEAGDVAGADAEIAGFARAADLLRHPVHQWYVPMWRAMRALMDGRLDDHRDHAMEADRLGRAAQSANSEVLLMAMGWFALLEQAEWSRAAETFAGFLADDPVAEFGIQALPSVALHHAVGGRFSEAAALIDANVDTLAGAPVDSEWLPMMVQVVDVVVMLGGHALGPWLYDTISPFAGRWVIEGIGAVDRGPVSLWLGRLAAVLGRTPEAVAHFEDALSRTRAVGASLLVARTLREWGFALDDVARLDEALVAYRSLGLPRRVEEIEGFLKTVSAAKTEPVTDPVATASSPSPDTAPASSDLLAREGDLWVLSYAGRVVRIRDSKGVRDIARLVAEVGREVAAVDLAGTPGVSARAMGGDLGPAVDSEARESYRRRLSAIEVELDEADSRSDAGRSTELQKEKAALVAQLSAAFGLGGRVRRQGDPAERARTAVTARIRDAIRRIEAAHPELGRHLARSIRTGAFCSYDP